MARITGVHRTWLDPDGFDRVRLGKAPIDTPRRAMGDLLGNAVRFGVADDDVLVAGEGIETMLSLRCVFRPCRWPLHCRPITSQPWRCRRVCVGSISPAMPMPPVMRCKLFCRSARKPPASKQSRCRLGWATSTRICTSSASMPSGQRCGIQLAPEDVVPLSALVGHRRMRRVCAAIDADSRSTDGPLCRRGRDARPSRGRSDGRRPGPAMAATGYFPPALRAFASRSKIAGLRHPPLRFGPPRCSGFWPVPPAV